MHFSSETNSVSLSIVIPVYNAEKWLSDCVRSALESYSGDLEVICVDDGSTDASPTILDELASSNRKINVIHQPNQGRCAARNTGIHHAKGTWITFLDADDQLMPDAWSNILPKVDGSADLVCTFGKLEMNLTPLAFHMPISSFDTTKLYPSEASEHLLAPARYTRQCQRKDVKQVLEQFDEIWCLSSCTKLYRNLIIKKDNLGFTDRLVYGEDALFTFDYLPHVNGFVQYIAVPTYRYNIGNSGTTRKYRTGNLAALIKTLNAWQMRTESHHEQAELLHIISFRCISDTLYTSMLAVYSLGFSLARNELAPLFTSKTIQYHCSNAVARQFRSINSITGPLWMLAFIFLNRQNEFAFLAVMAILSFLRFLGIALGGFFNKFVKH